MQKRMFYEEKKRIPSLSATEIVELFINTKLEGNDLKKNIANIIAQDEAQKCIEHYDVKKELVLTAIDEIKENENRNDRINKSSP